MFNAVQAMTFDNARIALDEGLHAIAGGAVAIDLAGIMAVDSSAVAVLLAWQRAAMEKSVTLSFDRPPANLSSLAELYGVAALLKIGPAIAPAPAAGEIAAVTPLHAELPQH